jgi:hypothetical protein
MPEGPKGIIDIKCANSTKSSLQAEFDVSENTSVIIVAVRMPMSIPAACFAMLGDTFRSFGLLGSRREPVSSQDLAGIFDTFHYQRNIWRWDAKVLLPRVCVSGISMFFLQGLANPNTLHLVIYLPVANIEKYVDIARSRFGASVRTRGECTTPNIPDL